MSRLGKFPFKSALNASTLIPFALNVREQIEVTAQAGYEGIELWVRDIQAYLDDGGTISQLRNCINDSGIAVVNGIAFFKWTDADETTREQGFKQAKQEIALLAELGCAAVAAPPSGDTTGVTLADMAVNFRRLTQVASAFGVEPYLEFWGKAPKLSRMSEALYVALESKVINPKILLDLFHMYTGGSDVDGLHVIDGQSIGIVHVNDYPATPKREDITDADRVFPGSGIGPTAKFASLIQKAGYNGYLSLELFIKDYGSKTALEVAEEGLAAIKQEYSIS